MNVLIETDFSISDIVMHKTNSDARYVVIGFVVHHADQNGIASGYTVVCSDFMGNSKYFYPFELIKLEM